MSSNGKITTTAEQQNFTKIQERVKDFLDRIITRQNEANDEKASKQNLNFNESLTDFTITVNVEGTVKDEKICAIILDGEALKEFIEIFKQLITRKYKGTEKPGADLLEVIQNIEKLNFPTMRFPLETIIAILTRYYELD